MEQGYLLSKIGGESQVLAEAPLYVEDQEQILEMADWLWFSKMCQPEAPGLHDHPEMCLQEYADRTSSYVFTPFQKD